MTPEVNKESIIEAFLPSKLLPETVRMEKITRQRLDGIRLPLDVTRKFLILIHPTYKCGKMEIGEQVNVKVDSKGRICIPTEIREEIGDTVTIKRTLQGFLLLPGRKKDSVEELRKVIKSKHRRTGKPENWPPEQIKAIWNKSKTVSSYKY